MNMVKIAVVILAAQAASAAAEEARPVAVDVRVESGSGELAERSGAVSRALLAGDNAGADQLLADLYSGAARKEAAPVQAVKCCPHAAAAEPQTVPAGTTGTATAPVTDVTINLPTVNGSVSQYIAMKTEELAKASAEEKEKNKEKEAKKEAEENAKKEKAFKFGVTLMTVALLLLILL